MKSTFSKENQNDTINTNTNTIFFLFLTEKIKHRPYETTTLLFHIDDDD